MTKTNPGNITFGPSGKEVDPFIVHATASILKDMGYRCISNAYTTIARIDREDWLDIMASQRRCSRADFYNVDGSGIGDNHIDFYVRVHSKDRQVVHPEIYQQLKKM
jgi:hypothetical protein